MKMTTGAFGANRGQMNGPSRDRSWRATQWLLVLVVGFGLGIHLLGVRQNLPYTPEVDEPIFVEAAIRIASSGDLNPRWFGNPGSTVIYPLAAIFRIWHAATHRGMFFHPDPNLYVAFQARASEFYLLGRLLTIAYAALSVPFVHKIGKRVFGEQIGAVGAWLSVLSPLALVCARMVRTDSAAVFFGVLSLWLIIRLYERPGPGRQIIAGLAIGLAIATRYFMVALVPVLLAVDGLLLWQQRAFSKKILRLYLYGAIGLLAVVIGFALSTPYFFLDFATAAKDLKVEARSTHLGADGLSPAGNLWFYLTQALPGAITWPLWILAIAGIFLALRRPRPEQMILAGFAVIFLGGISCSPLHWHRWIIQILPVAALFAAYSIVKIAGWIFLHLHLPSFGQVGLFVVLVLSAQPVGRQVLLGIKGLNPSARVLAREWILANLPAESHIAQEWYTAPLGGTDYAVFEQPSLAQGRTLEDYSREGYCYIVVSSAMYGRYLAEAGRYPAEVEFYQRLFRQGRLLQEFLPSTTRGGPTIRIYDICGLSGQ